MSKKNDIHVIAQLFKEEYAELDLTKGYKDRRSPIYYTCRFGEHHRTTLYHWKRGTRCDCFRKWERKLCGFNEAKTILTKYNAILLTTFKEYTGVMTPITFINCANKKQKISLSNLQLCEKIQDLKEAIISYYTEDKKLEDVVAYFKHNIIPMALRLWGANNSDCNRFIRVHIPKEDLYNMYWIEKKHPVYIAEKYNCSIGTVVDNMHNYDISLRTKSEARMGDLNPIYKVGHTKEARGKMSQAFVNGRTIGYSTCWGKTSKYNTPNQGIVTMRSTWEVRVADYLTELDKDWLYEPYTFKLTEAVSYRPDFYIPEDDLYIEVKGRLLPKDIIKIDTFRALGFNLFLWGREELEDLYLINSSGKINYVNEDI